MRIFLCLFALYLIHSSCATNRVKKVSKIDLPVLLEKMDNRITEYEWFSAKARVKFEGEEMRMTGRCNIRMIKDSLIWMNFKKVSVEGSRVLITRDSFWIVYRFDKIYESGTVEELMTAYDLSFSFSELQDFVLGHLPLPAEDDISFFESKQFHRLIFSLAGERYAYQVDGSGRIVSLVLTDDLRRQVNGSFGEFDPAGFAVNKSFEVNLSDGTRASVSLNFSDIQIDVPKKIKFEIPEGYRRLP